ncbi:MAG: CvpA family protein [Oscillospiraceae bacterium]|nr:CvpA family protein [Oscillospiraceae bacterium]
MALLIDLALLALWLFMIFWSARRGFFVTALNLGAWIVSLALAGTLSSALARPVYDAFFASAARRLIEENITSAVQGSQVTQYAQKVLSDLPEALTSLARVAGISTQSLIGNLQAHAFSSASAAELLEQAIVAPIASAVTRLALGALVFAVLMAATRLLVRQIAKLRKLPVLRQADRLLGAALGFLKGALLLFVVSLALRALAALRFGGPTFAQDVESAKLVQIASYFL